MANDIAIDAKHLAAFDPDAERAIEHTHIPCGSTIRLIQMVRDITDGSIQSDYVLAITWLPNGDLEATTLLGKDDIVLEIWPPLQPSRKPVPKPKRAGMEKLRRRS